MTARIHDVISIRNPLWFSELQRLRWPGLTAGVLVVGPVQCNCPVRSIGIRRYCFNCRLACSPSSVASSWLAADARQWSQWFLVNYSDREPRICTDAQRADSQQLRPTATATITVRANLYRSLSGTLALDADRPVKLAVRK